ncbi:MAG: hypothetical protein U9N09_03835 [Euryarchaeota archaeon]|nr:hypothetical protein [Euryarchaeota archaeon]
MKGITKPKGIGIAATVLLATLLIAAVSAPAMGAQENLLNSTDLASNYQNIDWDTVRSIDTSHSNGILYEIFFLKKGDTVKYLEIVDDGGDLQTKELTPSLISSVRNEEVLSTKSVKDEADVAETIRISGEDCYEIPGTILSVAVKHVWNTVESRNVLGPVLFSLTASGWFHYNPGVEVLSVTSDSSAYANGWYGWSVQSFSSSASWNTNIGTVNANAQFENLLGIIKNAWSQVQVDKDGNVYNDGAIS